VAEPAAARAHALRWVSGCGLRKAMRAYLRPGGLPPRRQCRRDVRRLRLAASSHGCRYGRRDGGIRGGAAERRRVFSCALVQFLPFRDILDISGSLFTYLF